MTVALAVPSRRRPGPVLALAGVAVVRWVAARAVGGDVQHLPRGATRGVVQQLAQLGKAQLHEAHQALANARPSGHKRHREARRQAQLGAGEGVSRGGESPDAG